jgi:UDP:flavonoid glycosyltransferase YjiC (YdhE family)
MARILWLNWSGGGNLPPSLGIARALTEHGHGVAFAGRPEMMPRVERAGFRAIELTRAYEQVAHYPNKYIPKAASFLSSPAVAEEIRVLLASEQPDLVIIDAMFPAALTEAARLDCPTIVMCHTCVYRMLEPWRQMLAMLVNLRIEAGFSPLPASLDELWMSRDRLMVTTLQALDPAQGTLAHPEKLRYVGPVLEQERHATPVALPWRDDDARPLVLVSFSTMPEQASVAKFQNTIDALGQLPVRAVVTTGDSLDPAKLKPAANVALFANADHEALMRRATMVVTHGGHGTMMRALKYGLPMVVIPGLASDQPVNAVSIEAWGAGRALPGDASADMIRTAVQDVLDMPSYGATARALGQKLKGVDGAANAAIEIEALLAASASPRSATAGAQRPAAHRQPVA